MSILTVRKYQNIICLTVEPDNRDDKEANLARTVKWNTALIRFGTEGSKKLSDFANPR